MMASNETRDHGDQSTWCQSNDPQCGSSTELSQTGQEKGDANCETSGGDGRILDDGLKDTSPGEQSKDPTRVPSGANQVQDDNDSGNASDETIQEPNATRETSAHQEAEQRKIRADAENRGLEQTKNLSLQDFKRAITKAADQMQEGEKKAHEKAQEASQTILDAMLWDVIKELPRDDYHILLAKHHLATCYFHMENYTQAEEFYREVLKAREAKKPSDPDLILRVRRDLVATLIRSAKRKDEKEDFLAEGMYTEAMNLAMQNINDATNSTPENDVDDVYTCLETLIEQVTPETKEHAELLKSSVYAQIRLGSGMTIDDWEGVKEAGIQAWNIYVFAEGDETTAHDIYDTIQTRLEDYQASSQEPNSPDCTEAIRIGDELRTEWKKSMTKARWQKALQAAKDQARQTIADLSPATSSENKVTAAILHAIDEWKTDIISISFGYQSIRTEELRNAIRKAIFQNVIVFGAAGNFGNTRANVSFPARLAGVFKIFACNHHGRGSSFSPNGTANSSYCFSTLGTNVVSIWPEDHREAANNDEAAKKGDIRIVDMPKQKGLWVAMSGTSFATPIAASLAAIIYQFYDVNKLIMSMPPSLKFKTVDVVRAVLLQMSMEADIDRYNYLNPAVGRDNFFNFREGRGEDRVSFFARKLADCIWAADI
ncbi:hypothetical protein K4K60_003763 [Colletotrichum sp. SAR11_57]|nr:hypothetical protein K4K60_003763 [Colletotrichum sp. SAR11_57]